MFTQIQTLYQANQLRIITNLNVERALQVWVEQMARKGEAVDGGMLVSKWNYFEEAMGVPEDERLTGCGWVQRFCSA